MNSLKGLFTRTQQPDTAQHNGLRLGMFGGVFMPTILTIMGVLYLRVGWTVGNAGLGGAC